ncbi:T9SS type A sorting domain-containing protein, partial [Carboxylicivirga mesophila]
SYSISKACKTPVTGTATVDCANDMGVSVFAEAPVAIIIDNTVSVEGNVLTANQDGMTYQWIDVDGNNTSIDGAISQSYTVTKTGNYSVIITNGTCGSVTSEPVNVTVTAIGRLNNRPVTIYPNPASSFVNVELGAVEGRVVISLINSNGSVVDNYETAESVMKMDISGLSPGVYILNIQATGFNHTIKFIKN